MAWHQAGALTLESGSDGTTAVATVSAALRVHAADGVLSADLGGARRTWAAGEITGVRSVRAQERFPAQWTILLDLEHGGQEPLLTSYDEETALRLMEAISADLRVPLVEHTGRSVEADEHGMSVLDQVRTYPGRFDRPKRLDAMEIDFDEAPDAATFKLPSSLEASGAWMVAATVALAGLLWFILLANLPDLAGNLQPLVVALIVLPIWVLGTTVLNRAGRSMENRHRLRLTRDGVELGARLAGLWPVLTRRYEIHAFRDLDAIKDPRDVAKGVERPRTRLTFLVGDQRVQASLPRREAEWMVGAIAGQIERLFDLPRRGPDAAPPPADEEA